MELAVVDSYPAGDVQQWLEEMCKLVGVQAQELRELPMHIRWKSLEASRRARRLLVEHLSLDWVKTFDRVLDWTG